MLERFKRFFSNETHEKPVPEGPPDDGLYQVNSDASRCVQCGICGFNCPVGIEVREYARRGQNVTDPRCINCGECIARCPRGTLRWAPALILRKDATLEVNPRELPELLKLTIRESR